MTKIQAKVCGDTAKLYAMKKAEDRLAASLEPKVKAKEPENCLHGISMIDSCSECLVREQSERQANDR